MGNMFCGYACVVYAMRGEYETAAPFIGIAIVLDMLDGRIARLTGTTSEFGVAVRLAGRRHLVRHRAGDPVVRVGPRRRSAVSGWAAGFLFVTAAAMRLARFNIQSGAGGDKRYFVGMPSPAAAGVPAATVFAYPVGLYDYRAALPVLAMVLVPAVLMVSTIRFRSFKTIDLQSRRPYTVLLLIAGGIVLICDASARGARRHGLHLPGVGVHRHGDHAVPASRRARRDPSARPETPSPSRDSSRHRR